MKNDKLTNSDERKGPVEVAIQLGLSEKEATRYYTEYWRLKAYTNYILSIKK